MDNLKMKKIRTVLSSALLAATFCFSSLSLAQGNPESLDSTEEAFIDSYQEMIVNVYTSFSRLDGSYPASLFDVIDEKDQKKLSGIIRYFEKRFMEQWGSHPESYLLVEYFDIGDTNSDHTLYKTRSTDIARQKVIAYQKAYELVTEKALPEKLELNSIISASEVLEARENRLHFLRLVFRDIRNTGTHLKEDKSGQLFLEVSPSTISGKQDDTHL